MLGSGIIITGCALITGVAVVKDNRRKKEMPWTAVAKKMAKKKKKKKSFLFLGGMKGLSDITLPTTTFRATTASVGASATSNGAIVRESISVSDVDDFAQWFDDPTLLSQLFSRYQKAQRELQSLLRRAIESTTRSTQSVLSQITPSSDSEPVIFLKYIRTYIQPRWPLVLLSIPGLLGTTLVNTYLALSLKSIVDSMLTISSSASILPMVGGLLIAFPLVAGLSLVGERLMAEIGGQISLEMSVSVFDKLQKLSLNFYKHSQLGDILSRATDDVKLIEKALVDLIRVLISALGMSLSLFLLFQLEWRLTLLIIFSLPIIGFLTKRLMARTVDAIYEFQKAKGQLANRFQENFRAQRVIKGLSLNLWYRGLFQEQIEDYTDKRIESQFLKAIIQQTYALSSLLTQLLVTCSGVLLVFWGNLSIGSLIAILTLVNVVNNEFNQLNKRTFKTIIDAMGSMRLLEELLQTMPQVADVPDALEVVEFKKELRFEQVSFAYSKRQPVLNGVNLTIPAEQYVAFVGPSGAGKSTILNLILRFYDVTEGRVTIDGVDIRQVTQASLREQMSVVFQQPFLFDTTILENIRVSKPNSTLEEVEAAAKAAEIHDFIVTLPQGYHTKVGDAGGRLSGGQRQRISIARALLRQPAILILDEPTASLDADTAADISRTLESLSKERTVISVTHLLSSVINADQIFVIDAGQVAERGTHEELLAQPGRYHQLWQCASSPLGGQTTI
jgi:ATP-binding cassette subfamily B protein